MTAVATGGGEDCLAKRVVWVHRMRAVARRSAKKLVKELAARTAWGGGGGEDGGGEATARG